ncbi:polyphosphate kinase [Heterostelium album PN500]|uniref:ATP-polyphosphate phosphotransferase n=1 Tax=Heterostelium pallidum (strain ATCC 26659 / Pp 5 / PN500) TaxID=670386 RepID=D3B5H9_HETP5|nr:polyphosphate kinase [Heterostelium album PN500]EFA83127.1 polyphosphate kinase [Heterostelium album PN500]|eukprot:XP_020435244.1 polyphosphate kinase [Heterostelium album PN500]
MDNKTTPDDKNVSSEYSNDFKHIMKSSLNVENQKTENISPFKSIDTTVSSDSINSEASNGTNTSTTTTTSTTDSANNLAAIINDDLNRRLVEDASSVNHIGNSINHLSVNDNTNHRENRVSPQSSIDEEITQFMNHNGNGNHHHHHHHSNHDDDDDYHHENGGSVKTEESDIESDDEKTTQPSFSSPCVTNESMNDYEDASTDSSDLSDSDNYDNTNAIPRKVINSNMPKRSSKEKERLLKLNGGGNHSGGSSGSNASKSKKKHLSFKDKLKEREKEKEKDKDHHKGDASTTEHFAHDKKLSSLRAECGQSPLFSPTEFVKSSTNNIQPTVGTQIHNLTSSLMGFRNLGASNLLSVQNPQVIPSSNNLPSNPMVFSIAPPVGNTLPDSDYLQKVQTDDDHFIVPCCNYPILDTENLFTDIVLPQTNPGNYLSTPSGGTPRLVPSASNSDIGQPTSYHLQPPSSSSSDYTKTNGLASSSHLPKSQLKPTNNNEETTTTTNNNNENDLTEDLPMDLKILQLSGSRIYFNRELTELIYFYRILYEGYNQAAPVLEKIRFLAITSQNLDMYFCKRALKLRLGYISTRKSLKPEERYINMVLNTTRNLINDKYNLFNNILLPELAANNVFLLSYKDLQDSEKFQLRAFFLQHVFPLMTPLVVDAGHPFPNLSNLSLNVGVILQHDEEGHTRFVRIKVPLKIPRFVHIKQRSNYSLIPMEEIILANLDTLFPNTKILTKSLFRVTRHYDLKLNEDEANDLLELIKTELHKRKFAPMVRLEVSSTMPKNIIEMLRIQLRLDEADVYIINGPLGLADLFELCKLNLPHLKFEPWVPHIPNRLANLSKIPSQDIFSVIRKGELLINLPYVSFNSSVQFFIESAVKDPKVLAIKIAIYRTSSNSQLIRSLCEAASHKEVSVLVDLKASGDEEQNTKYARLLEQAGCHVSYGLVGLKTHAKIAMVVREEENGLRMYNHYSTGNYNASTADIYADMGLFSCDQQLGADMCDLFNYLTGYSRITSFRKLLIAPMNMRSTLIQLIETEAQNAREGKEASILAVMNGLDDKKIVNALYHASVAGVTIKLVVRGRCRILPGIPGISHNIQVISILGRFLEHSRIYYFCNGGTPKAFIASADWLHRNLKRRVETLVPVEDPNNIKELRHVIDVYCNDPNAWFMLPDGRYKKTSSSDFAALGAQNVFIKSTYQKHPVIWSK